MAVAVEEEVEEEEVEVEEAQRQAARPQEEEEMQNSSGQNHLPSVEIARTSTDSSRIFKDICP